MARPRRPSTPLAAALVLAASACVADPSPPDDSAAEPIPADCATDAEVPKRELRGAWLTTVRNIDWPSEPGLSAAEQRAELVEWFDLAADLRLNAVYFHVRPTADAVYASELEPWARYLTGEQGGDPGLDPLAEAVELAHERGIELHAWFNPYRVGWEDPDLDGLVDDHPVSENPDWLVVHDDQGYLDPGNPDVRDWVTRVVLDVVTRYDIDGVHFDDYFYPYPGSGADFEDDASFADHGDGFDDRDAWRRENVNQLIRAVHEGIQQTRPWVQFGVSPFGVWRNADTDPTGSDTRALSSYDALHADTRTWVQEGWIDNVIPQVYWERGRDGADYEVLVPWWAEEVAGTDVDLYIGQAAYRAGDDGWTSDTALSDLLDLNAEHPEVAGDVYYSLGSLADNADAAISEVLDTHYTRPALPPPAHGGDDPPEPVADLRAERDGEAVELHWSPPEGARQFAVYRVPDPDADTDADSDTGSGADHDGLCVLADATHLVDVVGAAEGDTQSWTDPTGGDPGARYQVTALDAYRQESAPGPGARLD